MRPIKYVGTALTIVISIEEIFSIHYYEYIKNFCGIEEKHNFWEMVYVDGGSVTISADGDKFNLNRGEAYFHKPNERHNIFSNNNFASVFIISFATDSSDSVYFENLKTQINESEKKIISNILHECTKSFAGPLDVMNQSSLVRKADAYYGGEQMIKMYLQSLLIHIVRNEKIVVINSDFPKDIVLHSKHVIVDEIITILNQNLYKTITLDEICDKMSFSKSYIGKLFHDSIGQGIISYYNKLKIDETKKLISEGSLSITEISEKLSFYSIHYFSRTFKKIVGMSPTEYSKSIKASGLL